MKVMEKASFFGGGGNFDQIYIELRDQELFAQFVFVDILGALRFARWAPVVEAISGLILPPQASAATHPQGEAGSRSGNEVKTWSGCISLACAAHNGEIRSLVGKGGGRRWEVGVAH